MGSDTGFSASDNITKVNTPTITGSGDVGSIVKIVDGTTTIGTATVGSNGIWSITSSALSNGNRSLIFWIFKILRCQACKITCYCSVCRRLKLNSTFLTLLKNYK